MTADSHTTKDSGTANADWRSVCEWSALSPDGGTLASRAFVLEDEAGKALEGFIVRHNERVFAYRNSCPHQRVNLNWNPDQFLSADEQFIECSMHGALFTIDEGLCVRGPCVNQRLQALPIKVADGQVWVQVVYTVST